MKLSIIIPCYNEEEGIPQLASLLLPVVSNLKKKYSIQLIFVDDGSIDKTSELIKKHFGKVKGFELYKHPKNKNLGGALKTGFSKAKGDLIACLDSDCTYEPSILFNLLDAMDKDTFIVTASPYHPKGSVENVPEYRLVLSRTISMIYRLLTKSRIHTFTAMVRVYRSEIIKKVKFESDDFLSVAEILVYSLKKGYKVKEVPAVLKRRRFGESKIKLLRVILSHIKLISRLIVKFS